MNLLQKNLGIVALYAIAAALLIFTNPQHINPTLLVAPLLIFFFALFLTVIAILRRAAERRNRTVSRSAIILTGSLTAIPVLLLLLQSIGQLSTRDVVTIILIILVLGVYISKFGFARR